MMGYTVEVHEETHGKWKIVSTGRCRGGSSQKCSMPVVAALNRRKDHRYSPLWYCYCEMHLAVYGRFVRDGKLFEEIRIP